MSLRRTMLTAGKAAVKFGWDPVVAEAALSSALRLYVTGAPAPVAGTVASVQVPLTTASNVAFFSINPSSLVVTAISSTVAHPGGGLATLAVSFAVNAGDVLGIWLSGTGSTGWYGPNAPGVTTSWYRITGTAFTKPTAGQNLTSPLTVSPGAPGGGYPMRMQATLA